MVDGLILLAIDAVVLHFTLAILRYPWSRLPELPLLPLAAFCLMLNAGYVVAFTVASGQTIGKMLAHVRVVTEESWRVPVDAGRHQDGDRGAVPAAARAGLPAGLRRKGQAGAPRPPLEHSRGSRVSAAAPDSANDSYRRLPRDRGVLGLLSDRAGNRRFRRRPRPDVRAADPRRTRSGVGRHLRLVLRRRVGRDRGRASFRPRRSRSGGARRGRRHAGDAGVHPGVLRRRGRGLRRLPRVRRA